MRRRPLSYYNEEEITVPLQKGGDPCLTTYNEEEIPVPLCTMRRRPLSYYNRGGNPYSRGEETLPLLQGGGVPCPYFRGEETPDHYSRGGGGPCPYSRGKEAPAPTPGERRRPLPLLQGEEAPCPHSTPAPTPRGEEAHCPYSNPISWAVKQSWQPLLWKIASCPRDFAHIFLYNKTYLCNIAGGS